MVAIIGQEHRLVARHVNAVHRQYPASLLPRSNTTIGRFPD
jgi:hypothetical protein